MDEEWRVSLTACARPGGGKPVSTDAVRDLLRSRVGEEVSVSAGKADIFLYAATADAAAAAETAAREVLAEQGLAADLRLERWDPASQTWLPPGETAAAELPSGPELSPGRRRLRAAGALIESIIDGMGSGGL